MRIVEKEREEIKWERNWIEGEREREWTMIVLLWQLSLSSSFRTRKSSVLFAFFPSESSEGKKIERKEKKNKEREETERKERERKIWITWKSWIRFSSYSN